jgi:hypothetical protein
LQILQRWALGQEKFSFFAKNPLDGMEITVLPKRIRPGNKSNPVFWGEWHRPMMGLTIKIKVYNFFGSFFWFTCSVAKATV